MRSRRAGERVLASISRYLQQRLKLVVNASKSHVVKTSESKFLGFTFKTGKILIHPKTLQRFKQQVRRLTNRNWGVAMEYQLSKPANTCAAGSTTLVSPTAINSAWSWINGSAAGYGWPTGGSGESRAPRYGT